MLHVVYTIVPVFVIIMLGCVLRARGFLPGRLIEPLNRIVYYFAIPAMIFREVATASFQASFQPLLVAGTLIPVFLVFVIGFGMGRLISVRRPDLGTFLQSSFHGNLGYIGLAVAFYLLGKEGLTRASILAGFLLVLQNLLSVVVLLTYSGGPKREQRHWFFAGKVFGNPIILSALAGMVFSIGKVPLPETVQRTLSILGGMALPLALLVIGASLSFGLIRAHLVPAAGAGFLKLVVLPGLGLWVYRWLGLSETQFLPGMILLASPTATITYVMACEMKGSPELASAAVSMNTLLSGLTFIVWLSLFS